jgi:hypothetical protein
MFLPGYTVITSSMSAAKAIWSVMVVEGVSGEIATPAFIFRRWMESMRDNGLADMGGQ